MNHNLFDAGPDPTLGALLREQLEGEDLAGFTARVRRRLPGRVTLWDTLADWARPGIAAALLLAAALGYWVVRQVPAAAPGSVEALAVEPPVERDAVMSVVLGER
jgi:hypothetical protein